MYGGFFKWIYGGFSENYLKDAFYTRSKKILLLILKALLKKSRKKIKKKNRNELFQHLLWNFWSSLGNNPWTNPDEINHKGLFLFGKINFQCQKKQFSIAYRSTKKLYLGKALMFLRTRWFHYFQERWSTCELREFWRKIHWRLLISNILVTLATALYFPPTSQLTITFLTSTFMTNLFNIMLNNI